MKVLLADDNPFFRLALATTLREWGYDVVTVEDGAAALEVLQQDDAPKLAVLDWVMPGLDGPAVCRRVRELDSPEPTFILILTVKDGKQNIITALESGADDFLTKPFDREELKARLRVGARIVGLQTSQTAIYTFARAVEAKSPYTHGHADRVTQYALALGDRVGLSRPDRDMLRRGSLLHDIGKISIPDAILNKPGPLTREEYEIVKQHPVTGVKMIESLRSLADVVPLIRWHHERLDGRGYPDGLRGDQISPLVRILSIADCYDAMASARPYRPLLSRDECLRRLRADAERGGLDAGMVNRFCEIPFLEESLLAPPTIELPGVGHVLPEAV